LDIDKDSVYRRLRGEVTFSFVEMAAIAKKLGISLDSILGIESLLSKPTQISMTKHVNPTDLDYRMYNDFINLLIFIKDEPDTKLIESGNIFPYFLFYDYEYFTRFYIFCWNLASGLGTALPFHEVTIPEQLRVLQKNCSFYARHIKSTQYMWDYMIFYYLVENIKFYAGVGLINEEDVSLIKNDLINFLITVEKLVLTGKHEDTGNEVSFYISQVDLLTTNYICIESKNLNISLIKNFLLMSISALDKDVYNEVSTWILATQRSSTLITVSGEKFRADFFEKQWEIINSL
jgi:hypothetical protein